MAGWRARSAGRPFEGAVGAGHGDQFRLQAGGEDAGMAFPTGAGQGAATQRGIDVDVAVGDHFGAGADHGQDDQVAARA